MEIWLFDQVADALRGMVDDDLGELVTSHHRYGIKAWFDDPVCPKEHYEAQVVGAKHVPEASTLAIEVGFHAEHPDQKLNESLLAELVSAERSWRADLGDATVAGPFLGRATWRRLSETWPDPDLSDPEACFEVAETLAAYINTIEPLRRG